MEDSVKELSTRVAVVTEAETSKLLNNREITSKAPSPKSRDRVLTEHNQLQAVSEKRTLDAVVRTNDLSKGINRGLSQQLIEQREETASAHEDNLAQQLAEAVYLHGVDRT